LLDHRDTPAPCAAGARYRQENRLTMTKHIAPCTAVSFALSLLAAWAAPEYAPVPARLLNARGGLGNVITKLNDGREVRIAYFGGSITAANGWRPQTLEWFRRTWPQATVVEINAAIGGTGSDLGVYRFGQDVLAHDPDLIFVEFAVNDGGADPLMIWRAMEGIVRQAWAKDPETGICYVYTFRTGYENDLNRGLCPRAASADEMLAEHYGIPSINVALRTVQLANEGRLLYVPGKVEAGDAKPTPEGVMLFSTDGVHPLETAHRMYTDVIAAAVEQMAANPSPGPHELGAPFVENNMERARMVPLRPAMLSAGWRKLDARDPMAGRFSRFMPELWQADRPGETLSFRFTGTAAGLYDIIGPDGAQVTITIDGETMAPRPRFDSYCSYHRIASLGIARDLEDGEHTVTVAIHPEQPDRSSVTDKEKAKPGFDPRKYDGTAFRVAAIMLIGEVVE